MLAGDTPKLRASVAGSKRLSQSLIPKVPRSE